MKEFYKHTDRLDELKVAQRPGERELKGLMEVIAGDDDLAYYFYGDNNNPSWVHPLSQTGEFEALSATGPELGLRTRSQAKYLSEVASNADDKTARELVALIRDTTPGNELVRAFLLDALLKIPPDVAAVAAEAVASYLAGRNLKHWHFVGERAAKLMVRFCSDHPEEAFRIAEELLEVWAQREEAPVFGSEMAAKFSAYEYEELIFEHYSHVWEQYPCRAVMLPIQLLAVYLAELGDPRNYYVSVGLHATLQEMETTQRYHREIICSIIGGVVGAGKAVIEREAVKIDELFDALLADEIALFERIGMHLLRFVPAGAQTERINRIIGNRRFLAVPYWKAEYKWLLHDKFDEIGPEARHVFKQWIEESRLYDEKAVEKLREDGFIGDVTDEQVAAWEAQHKAQELYPLRDKMPELFERYRDEAKLTEEEVAPRPRISHAGFVRPTEGSPLAEEEAEKRDAVEVIEYALDSSKWPKERKVVTANTPEEALSGVLEGDVKKRPDAYLQVSHEKIAALSPRLLMSFLYGLKQSIQQKKLETEDWPSILALLRHVVGERGPAEEYAYPLQHVLDVAKEALDEKGVPIAPTADNLVAAWEVARPLLEYAYDVSPVLGRDLDAYTESLNVVQGGTCELLIRLAIHAKDKATTVFDDVLRERLRDVLKRVVEEIRTPWVNSVVGTWFGALCWADEDWVKENLDRIFDETNDHLWDAVWCAYLSWGRFWKRAFDILREAGKYEYGLKRLGAYPKETHGKSAEQALAEHIGNAYLQGWIPLDDPLLTAFLQAAPAKLRGHAATYLSGAFESLRQKPDGDMSARAANYWRSRIEGIERNPEQGIEEAVAFLHWIKDAPVDAKGAFGLLKRTLDLTEGKLGEHLDVADFVKGICELAEGNELAALQCLLRAVGEQQKLAAEFYAYGDELTDFMNHLVELPDDYPEVDQIRQAGMALADAYGRMGNYKYRDAYQALASTPNN